MNMNKYFYNTFVKYYYLILVLICLAFFSPENFSQPLALGYDKFLGNVYPFTDSNWEKYWNQVTPENAGKWGSVEGTRNVYSWGGLDAAYNFSKQRGLPFKMHNLVWGQQQPYWISSLSDDEKRAEIEEWIRLVGERYPDMDFVDVVNEPLAGHNPPDGGNGRANYKDALGGNGTTGWDWVIWVFEKARQYIPKAKLLINDFNIINSSSSTTSYLTVINLLKERNLIDGIGIQGHRFELENTSNSTLNSNLDKLAETGLPIYISEFDLGNIGDSGTPDDNVQLQLYQRIFPVLWEHPGVEGITFWGYKQGQIWQSSCYLVRSDGTERPALQWLWQYLTKVGTIRSYQSGNWNDLNSWESYSGSQWIHPAAGVPSVTDDVIKIQKGHTITVTESTSADQLFILSGGTLIINPNINLTINNGTGNDLIVSGTIENSGTIVKDDSAVVEFTGGSYFHEQDGGSVPIATWESSSTVQFDNIKTSAPSNLNQDFYNVIWNCSDQTSDMNLGWNGNTISGNVTVKNTGTASLYMCAPATGISVTVIINGNLTQTGGTLSANGTNSGNTSVMINHNGNINVTGGNFSISLGSQGGSGTTVWNLVNGNFSLRNAATQNLNPNGAKFVFSKMGTQTLTLGTGNTLTALPIEVINGATLSMGTSVLEGSGSFILDAGGTIETTLPEGIDGNLKNTGTINLSSEGGYNFSGTSSQVTGNLMPNVVNNLMVNNSTGVTLSKNATINGILEIKKGSILLGGNNFTYGEEASLKYSGTTDQTTSDVEFPEQGGPKNLVIGNKSGVTLHAARVIPGYLRVDGKLKIGDNDFTAASASSTGNSQYVVMNGSGVLRLTAVGQSESLFPVGTSSYYAPVWVTNTGDLDVIGVNLSEDATPAPEGGRIKVKWELTEGTEGGGNYILKFGWSRSLEDTPFRSDRENNAYIFNLADTTEAGTGPYTKQFDIQPYTISRGGITTLGPFGVGKFGEVTGVDKNIKNNPQSYVLNQNYPNPFNPSTTIQYSLAKATNVTITIYNILGMKICTLVNSYQTSGEHSIMWYAKDDFNNPVSSGIYFYRLEVGNMSLQKKMALLR